MSGADPESSAPAAPPSRRTRLVVALLKNIDGAMADSVMLAKRSSEMQLSATTKAAAPSSENTIWLGL
jgi:hypothetical protein